jgi:hypothetical protein
LALAIPHVHCAHPNTREARRSRRRNLPPLAARIALHPLFCEPQKVI